MNYFLHHGPKYVYLLTDNKDLFVNIVLAFVTFLAVIAAFLQEKIRRMFSRATLDMEINLIPPDSHQIDITNSDGSSPRKSIYIRIKVTHIKGAAGENVEIMPISFNEIDELGVSTPITYFLPINLVWSHFQPRTNTIRVPVGLFRHCDLGHVIELRPHNGPVLILDTMVQPNKISDNRIPNVFHPGKYQFELLLSGDNVKVLKKKWEIQIIDWSDTESVMLNNNLIIKEIK
jgi:hypothetical protein